MCCGQLGCKPQLVHQRRGGQEQGAPRGSSACRRHADGMILSRVHVRIKSVSLYEVPVQTAFIWKGVETAGTGKVLRTPHGTP